MYNCVVGTNIYSHFIPSAIGTALYMHGYRVWVWIDELDLIGRITVADVLELVEDR